MKISKAPRKNTYRSIQDVKVTILEKRILLTARMKESRTNTVPKTPSLPIINTFRLRESRAKINRITVEDYIIHSSNLTE